MIMRTHEGKAATNQLRSGEKKWNWSRSSIGRIWPLSGHGRPNRHLSLSGGIKGGGGFHTTHMFHFGTARSHSGVDQKAKLQLLKQFIMETE